MENQELSLLEEIVENPNEDAPRLIYADWLEERGNPRAEFIRVQCQLAALGSESPRELLRIEQSLFAEHRRDWLDQLALPLMWYAFRRGFVEDVVFRAGEFIRQQGRILEVSPIRRLRTNLANRDQATEFAQLTSLRHLRLLHISIRYLDHDLLMPLMMSPHLTGLSRLSLLDASLDRSGIEQLRRQFL